MVGFQPVDAGSEKPLFPATDRRSGRSKPLLDGAVPTTLSEHQDQPGAENITCRQRT
jgi:hypothetical protein